MKWDLAKVLKNPDIAIGQQFGAEGDTDAARQLRRAKADADKARLVAEFEQVWRGLGGPELVAEYRFHKTRKWRADFAHEPTKVLIEIEGGIWSGGRHVRGKGYQEDCEKYLSAVISGYAVIRLTAGMLTDQYVFAIIDFINRRSSYG